MSPESTSTPRRIRSFVLRAGRMTPAQQRGLDEGWPRWGVEFTGELLDFDNVFSTSGERVLEIGFGMGQSLLAMAIANPQRRYLGVEVHRPGVGKLLHDIDEAGITNLRVMRHDAVEVLEQMIAPASLDRIQIFFPDPWHKKRHHKRRLIQDDSAKLLASRLAPGGLVHLATDWEPYAEHMLEVLNACPDLANTAPQQDFVERPEERPQTRFEARGERLGHGVWDLVYRRTA